MEEHAIRLGLGPATLKAAILAELDAKKLGAAEVEMIASAVANTIEANNIEVLRQLRQILVLEPAPAPGAESSNPP
jgi:acetyl-CoA carboxylase carboxyltransferase component